MESLLEDMILIHPTVLKQTEQEWIWNVPFTGFYLNPFTDSFKAWNFSLSDGGFSSEVNVMITCPRAGNTNISIRIREMVALEKVSLAFRNLAEQSLIHCHFLGTEFKQIEDQIIIRKPIEIDNLDALNSLEFTLKMD
jgi:hypothetical protein